MATIADLLDERSIDLSLSSGDKDDAIERMVDLVDASGALLDRDVLIKAVRAREEAGTTGLGEASLSRTVSATVSTARHWLLPVVTRV